MGRFGCAVLVGFGLVGFGLFITWVMKGRAAQSRLYDTNNLRVLAQAVGRNAPDPDRPLFASEKTKAPPPDKPAAGPSAVPAGTVVNPALPPDRRLSWVVHLLSQLDADAQQVAGGIDRGQPWDGEKNKAAAQTRLAVLNSYSHPPAVPSGAPAVTQYVGAGGVGADAPSLAWANDKPPPTAGCFRYDAPTPFSAITDGLSGTILFAEVSADLGPWLQGGPATVRTFDPAGKSPVGVGGQFGGNQPGGGLFAFADTSVRFLSDRTSKDVLHGLFTIAGGQSDPVPGD
ncbi:MAG: DUF1559 domain-containing protein [Gemmataceae bacterium]